jgi:hypothetical protein
VKGLQPFLGHGAPEPFETIDGHPGTDGGSVNRPDRASADQVRLPPLLFQIAKDADLKSPAGRPSRQHQCTLYFRFTR